MRDQQLQRLRTEILAGKGPDIFLTDVYNHVVGDAEIGKWGVEGKGPLFNFPAQAMKNRLFLPLDDYIAQAQFMEFDQLTPRLWPWARTRRDSSFSPWLLILMWPPMCPQIMACRGRGPKHARKCWILAAPPWLLPPRGGGETAFSGLTPTAPMAVATSAIL